MKKLSLVFCLLLVSAFAIWKITVKKNSYLEESEIEEDEDFEFVPGITGPGGEKVFIGAGGGRYYSKDSSDMYAGAAQ